MPRGFLLESLRSPSLIPSFVRSGDLGACSYTRDPDKALTFDTRAAAEDYVKRYLVEPVVINPA